MWEPTPRNPRASRTPRRWLGAGERGCHNAAVPSEGELVLRLLLAAGLAAALGVERELHEQPAGFRTHMLVGVGAALFAVISAFGFQAIAGLGPSHEVRADVTRVASQIVVGIGFLGGGAIIKYGATVRGLTTAASLWVTAAVGTAAGIGMLAIATATTGIALLALAAFRPIRVAIRRLGGGHVEFTVESDHEFRLGDVTLALRTAGIRVTHFELIEDQPDARSWVLVVQLPRGKGPEDVVSRFETDPHVRHVDWTR
jgi:putative Mg2+ transporter-C (MgtC) family protein